MACTVYHLQVIMHVKLLHASTELVNRFHPVITKSLLLALLSRTVKSSLKNKIERDNMLKKLVLRWPICY